MNILVYILYAIAFISALSGSFRLSSILYGKKKKGRKSQTEINNRNRQIFINIILIVFGLILAFTLDYFFGGIEI